MRSLRCAAILEDPHRARKKGLTWFRGRGSEADIANKGKAADKQGHKRLRNAAIMALPGKYESTKSKMLHVFIRQEHHMRIHVHLHIHTYTQMYMCIYIYTHIHVYTYPYICTYTYAYKYAYTYTCMHLHVHIHKTCKMMHVNTVGSMCLYTHKT